MRLKRENICIFVQFFCRPLFVVMHSNFLPPPPPHTLWMDDMTILDTLITSGLDVGCDHFSHIVSFCWFLRSMSEPDENNNNKIILHDALPALNQLIFDPVLLLLPLPPAATMHYLQMALYTCADSVSQQQGNAKKCNGTFCDVLVPLFTLIFFRIVNEFSIEFPH